MDRRRFLATSATVIQIGLAGCGHLPPGSIRVRNEQNQAHTVHISINKISENEDDAHGDTDPVITPTTRPIWEKELSIDVPANNDKVKTRVITESGAFFIEVELDSGVNAATWLGLYTDAAGGVAEEMLLITIRNDGSIIISSPSAE